MNTYSGFVFVFDYFLSSVVSEIPACHDFLSFFLYLFCLSIY